MVSTTLFRDLLVAAIFLYSTAVLGLRAEEQTVPTNSEQEANGQSTTLTRKQMRLLSKRSQQGVLVQIQHGDGGERKLSIMLPQKGQSLTGTVPLPVGTGVPLQRITTDRSTHMVPDERKLAQSVKQFDSHDVVTLGDFGILDAAHVNVVRNRMLGRYDHKHLWSADGNTLYVLRGVNPECHLLKVNARTWEIEQQMKLDGDWWDIAWTSYGITALVSHSNDPRQRSVLDSDGKRWWQALPPGYERSFEIVVLDPVTLKRKEAWCHPPIVQLAGSRNSDIVFGRSEYSELLVSNIRTGELLDIVKTSGERGWHPTILDGGKWLMTGTPDDVRRYAIDGLQLGEEQSRARKLPRRVRGAHLKATDLGFAEGFLGIANDGGFDFTRVSEFGKNLGSVSVTPGTGIGMDSHRKAVYFCGLNPLGTELKLRVLTADEDVEYTLQDPVDILRSIPTDLTENRELRPKQLVDTLRVRREMYWPFAMSVAPEGRGVIVFAGRSAFWVEAKSARISQRWPFQSPHSTNRLAQQPGSMPSMGQVGRMAQAATALVELPDSQRTATAFCVGRGGLFVTASQQLVGLKPGFELPIVLRAGQLNEQSMSCSVSRTDLESGLTLLQLNEAAQVEPLRLGNESALTTATPLTLFGYPGPKSDSARRHPAAEMIRAKVSALRKDEGGTLELIQLDGRLLPGNSGGPALDASGRVVGIVHGGIIGAEINFLLPVHKLRELMLPGIDFRSPALSPEQTSEGIEFEVRAKHYATSTGSLQLQLTFPETGPESRTYAMEFIDGIHRATVGVPDGSAGTADEPLTVDYSITASVDGIVVGECSERLTHSPVQTRLITPQLATYRDEIDLDTAISDLTVGGAGRWIVLYLRVPRELAIFDSRAARIVRRIKVDDPTMMMAANLEHLVVFLPRLGKVQRWNLASLELEGESSIPVQGRIKNIAMGSGGNGPMLIRSIGADDGNSDTWSLFDPATMRNEALRFHEKSGPPPIEPETDLRIQAGNTGKAFVLLAGGSEWYSLTLDSGFATVYTGENDVGGYVTPDPKGKKYFSEIAEYSLQTERIEYRAGRFCLPAHQGSYRLQLDQIGTRGGSISVYGAALFLEGEQRMLIPLPELDYKTLTSIPPDSVLHLDQRCHFIPSAGLFVTIPQGNTRLVLHHFESERRLKLHSSPQAKLASLPTRKSRSVKDSVALVVRGKNSSVGSSFCVHSDGFFVTNAHVVGSLGSKATLVLHSGEVAETSVPCTVVRIDRGADLALMKTDNTIDVPALSIGFESSVSVGQKLTAYGFPFGNALSIAQKNYPSVSVNEGPVVKLDRSVFDRDAIELRMQVNPGNSGGPLVNESGELVGVIHATKIAQRESFAIPVAALRQFLHHPIIEFLPPDLDTSQPRAPLAFIAQATHFVDADQPIELELMLAPRDGEPHRHLLVPDSDRYGITTVPISSTQFLRVKLDYAAGSIEGVVADRSIRVGGTECMLSQLRSIQFEGETHAMQLNSTRLLGKVEGLTKVPVRVGLINLELDWSRAFAASLNPEAASPVEYTLRAMRGGEEFDRLSGTLEYANSDE